MLSYVCSSPAQQPLGENLTFLWAGMG